jgi:nucleotide-binding universal stress UspA family protein
MPMSYAALMVHLDLAGGNEARLAVAAGLAERCGAAMIGIAACDPQPAPYFYAAYGDQILGEDRARVEAQLDELGRDFRKAMEGRVKTVAWRAALAPPVHYVARAARAADLLVVGARPDSGLADPLWDLDIADLIMQAGRPVLVVPPDGKPLNFDAAVVAWKDTREARRAVSDALPLLRLCRRTVVATLAEDEQGEDPQPRHGAEDVVAWLERHGIAAQAMAMLDFGDTAGQLDAIAAERGADFIVAGAYGHSRLSEWVFGGVTRGLLTRIPRCLLLAH